MPTHEPTTHPITIRVSTEMLDEIDALLPDRRRACRERFVMDAVLAYLGHREKVVYKDIEAELLRRSLKAATGLLDKDPKPAAVTKAISESADAFKTGRYEP